MRRIPFALMGSGGSPPPAPTITPGANYAIVDSLGGGQDLVWAGTDLDTVYSVDFGGSAGTITAQSPTSITVTAPAHAAGAGVVVTFSNAGGSDTDTIEYVDPTAFVDFWIEGPDYSYSLGASVWTPRKGVDNVDSIATDPTVGATLGGLATVDFDGSQHLRHSDSILNYVTSTSWFNLALFNARTIGSDSGTLEANNTIYQEANGQNHGLELRGTGPSAYAYQYGAPTGKGTQTIATGTWELFRSKNDGSNIKSALGSAAWTTGDAVGGAGIGANAMLVGKGGAFFDGQLAILALAITPPSDANITKMIAAINQRWGTAY